ncbi:hypothetical protein [Streptomyces sp. SYSU K217416]
MKRRTAVLAALVVAGAAAGSPAVAADTTFGPLVSTGDVDLLEDVLEHISVPAGEGSRAVHQMYDSRAGAAD